MFASLEKPALNWRLRIVQTHPDEIRRGSNRTILNRQFRLFFGSPNKVSPLQIVELLIGVFADNHLIFSIQKWCNQFSYCQLHPAHLLYSEDHSDNALHG
jgi:hypothetical protein